MRNSHDDFHAKYTRYGLPKLELFPQVDRIEITVDEQANCYSMMWAGDMDFGSVEFNALSEPDRLDLDLAAIGQLLKKQSYGGPLQMPKPNLGARSIRLDVRVSEGLYGELVKFMDKHNLTISCAVREGLAKLVGKPELAVQWNAADG